MRMRRMIMQMASTAVKEVEENMFLNDLYTCVCVCVV